MNFKLLDSFLSFLALATHGRLNLIPQNLEVFSDAICGNGSSIIYR
jgi:hypothetical protein